MKQRPLSRDRAPVTVKPRALEPRIGYDGQPQTNGHWDTEYHPDLATWEDRVERLNELRTGDASIVGAVEKIWWSVARASWDVDSQAESKDDDPATMLARANILRAGAPELAAYRMRTRWRQFLWECFTAELFGSSFFEIVERVQAGPLGTFRVIDHAAWMHPASIWQIRVDREGFLLGVVQRFQARWWDESKSGTERYGQEQSDWFEDFLPASSLFVRTRKQEGSNVEGISMLRGMYGDAKRNQSLRNWQAIHAQRVAVGIPKVKLAPEAPPEIQSRAIDMAKAMRGGAQDRLYVVETPGVEVGWVSNETGAIDVSPMLRAGEDRLRGVASLEWAGLGLSGAGGARAVGDVQQRPYWLMCEGIAEGIAEDIQTELIDKRLVRPNFGADHPSPSLRAADVSPPDVDAIVKASAGGLVRLTGEDENALRRSLKMRALRRDELDRRALMDGINVAGLNDLALAKAVAMTGDVLESVHEALGLPPLPPKKVREYNDAPMNAGGVGFGASSAPPAQDDEPEPKGKPEKDGKRKPKPPQAKPEPPPEPEADDDAEAEELAERIELAAKRGPKTPTAYESAHVALDLLRGSHDDLAREAAVALRRLREDAVAEMLKGARIKGSTITLGKPGKSAKAMRAALLEIADKAREVGRESLRQEIRSQVAGLVEPKETLGQKVARAIGLADPPPPFDPFSGSPAGRAIVGTVRVVDAFNEELETFVTLDVEAVMDALSKTLKRGLAEAIAQEMTEAEAIEFARARGLDLSDAPLEQAGRSAASRGINGGRAEVAEQAMESLEGEGLTVEVATRTSVLEPSTCDECEALHGTTVDVGSDDYFALMPPARCAGGDYCRCLYLYSVVPA